jgi:glycine cleavage system transcriptional repressor
MNKAVISILGPDRPGIIAAVTRILFDQECNIENVSQTILQSEFSGIFIAAVPKGLDIRVLHDHLYDGLSPLNMHVFVKRLDTEAGPGFNVRNSEPFVITTKGPDRKGLVAAITEIIARYGANVTNLQAVFKGGDDPSDNIMIYEVDIPNDVDAQALFTDLRSKATELSLDISVQHRNIFEAINRV